MQRPDEVMATVPATLRRANQRGIACCVVFLAGLALLLADARADTGSEPNRDGGSETPRVGDAGKDKPSKREAPPKLGESPALPPAPAPNVGGTRDTRPPANPAPIPAVNPPPVPSAPQPAVPTPQAPVAPAKEDSKSKKDSALSQDGNPKGLNPATGTSTPAIASQADRFTLVHRRMLPDEDLAIKVERGSEKHRIHIQKVELFYEQVEDGDADKQATSEPRDRMRSLDLTPYQSLDADSGQLHIALHHRYLAQETTPIKPTPSIWKKNFALWRSQPATLVISYVSVDEGKNPKVEEQRTVTLRPAFTNRLRGIFWGVLGLLVSLLCTCLIGLGQLRRRQRDAEQTAVSRGETFWYVLLGASCTATDRFSLSGLQVMIWTHVAAFSLSYVWTMTGEVVELTPQLLMLLGIGGGTAVLARVTRVSVPPGLDGLLNGRRLAGPWDLIASADAPSVFKFQMLIFTLVSASIVSWEVASTYTFPVLPDALVTLMGISNSTYLLGSLASNSGSGDLKKEIEDSVRALDAVIEEWNKGNQSVSEKWKRWSRSLLVQRFTKPTAEDQPLSEQVQTLLQTLQNNLNRLVG